MPRTVGSYQKRTFLDTSLGRLIYLVEPDVFSFICPKLEEGFAPDAGLITAICNKIDNPSFKTKRFYGYLDEYVTHGLRVRRRKKITEDIVSHYEKIRKRRILNKINHT